MSSASTSGMVARRRCSTSTWRSRRARGSIYHGEIRMSPEVPFRHFHDQLTALNRRLLAMSEKAESLIALSVDALLSQDAGKAEAVIDADRELDSMELEIEAAALG